MKIFFSLKKQIIKKIDKNIFLEIEQNLIETNQAEDRITGVEIKERLKNPPILSAEDFAKEIFYVILASGFKQQTAKIKWAEICESIDKNGANEEELLKIFNNQQKINAIMKNWQFREQNKTEFYALNPDFTLSEDAITKAQNKQIDFLETLPYIGPTTKNHIARNLGINVVKYDVWIQRLGIAQHGVKNLNYDITFPAKPLVKGYCDQMFKEIADATGNPWGYIDLILWKACSIGILEIKE